MNESTENRRPLKTRQWSIFRNLAERLARMSITPNMISVTSVLWGCCAGLALGGTSPGEADSLRRGLWSLAALMIQFRLLANLLDGMVAIEGGKKSIVGELYNEVPDRIADPAILIGAGFAFGGSVSLGLLAAVVALFVAYVRAMGTSVGVGQVFMGPMAKPQRMALLTALSLYCCVAPLAWQPLWRDGYGVISLGLLVIIAGGVFTAIRRLRRIAQLMRERADTNESV